uniref:DUF4304 domain-containing protein n=1 Tax=Heterorhabditis bacteriophora TaxID=37862 RepID=A0A1I7XLN6_HETBA
MNRFRCRWLQHRYGMVKEEVPPIKHTYERLKTIVDNGVRNNYIISLYPYGKYIKYNGKKTIIKEPKMLSIFLSTYGWPEDTNFEEIVPQIIDIYLEHNEWDDVKKMLTSLFRSAKSDRWIREDETSYTPVKNYHLLSVLRRKCLEGQELSLKELNDYSYELKRLFPNSTVQYDNFLQTIYEYNKLFGLCLERIPNPSVNMIDECITLLKTLIKLDILSLHSNETLTTVFIAKKLCITKMAVHGTMKR